MNSKYNNSILQYSTLIFCLSIFSFFFLLPVELYGSTISCDPSNLTNCDKDEKSSSPSSSSTAVENNVKSDNTETPLVLPDISPTEKDLGTPTANPGPDDASNIDSGDNNDDSGDQDTNRDDKKESEQGSGNNEDKSSDDDEHSLIPFP
jgi:hypothetical protein